MTVVSAALLGVVQGVTEFLPVSSSGHLILARAVFGDASSPDPLALPFDVFCHVGTLLAVVVFFRADILAMIRALPAVFGPAPSPDAKRIRLIVVGTIPVVIVGLLFADRIDAVVRTPMIAATALLLGALLLLIIERVGTHGHGEDALSLAGAFAIGVAQSAALVPGVSRSGATIATGMALGLRRDVAARFTFLMSVPAIAAAGVKEGLDLRHVAMPAGSMLVLAVGMVTSAIVGYLTVKYFVRFLATHRLDVFAWYRIVVAVAVLVWLNAR